VNIKWVVFSKYFSQAFLIQRIIVQDINIIVLRPSHKVHVILVRFYWNLNFLKKFSKDIPVSNSMKILPEHQNIVKLYSARINSLHMFSLISMLTKKETFWDYHTVYVALSHTSAFKWTNSYIWLGVKVWPLGLPKYCNFYLPKISNNNLVSHIERGTWAEGVWE